MARWKQSSRWIVFTAVMLLLPAGSARADAGEPPPPATAPAENVPEKPATPDPVPEPRSERPSLKGIAAATSMAAVVMGAITLLEWVLASVTLFIPFGIVAGIYAASVGGVQWAQQFITELACLALCLILCFPVIGLTLIAGSLLTWTLESLLGPLSSLVASGFAGLLGYGSVSLVGERRAPLLPFVLVAMLPNMAAGALGCLAQGAAMVTMVGLCAATEGKLDVETNQGKAVLGVQVAAFFTFILAPLVTSTAGNAASVVATGVGSGLIGRNKAPAETYQLDVFTAADAPEPL